MAKPKEPIDDRIREAFTGYEETLEVLRGFQASRTHAEEFAILVRARLDSLANLAAEGKTQHQRFINFVRTYSDKRPTLDMVSVPNLYSYLARLHDAALYMFEIPGRVRIIDQSEDLQFFRFLAAIELPLTKEAISRILRWFSIVIQKKYRTTSTQSRSKPSLDRVSAILDLLEQAAVSRKSDQYAKATAKLRPLAEYFSVASVLYRDFRSGAIHEYGFAVSEARFFQEPGPFFDTIHFVYDPDTRYLDLQFSAPWLVELLVGCLTNYRNRLLATKKLQMPLFLEVADVMTEGEFLADSPDAGERFIPFALGR